MGALALTGALTVELTDDVRLLRAYVLSETAAGFSAEDLKRAEAQWREQGSPNGLTSY